jgi:hypothetical protein
MIMAEWISLGEHVTVQGWRFLVQDGKCIVSSNGALAFDESADAPWETQYTAEELDEIGAAYHAAAARVRAQRDAAERVKVLQQEEQQWEQRQDQAEQEHSS